MEKRKRGRPPLPKNIVEYCITAAIQHPDMPRKELMAKVETELSAMKLKPPGRDKMLKLFQMAPEKTEEDKPWSVGKSVQYSLSPQATSDLFFIWSWCLAAGLNFTVRDAKWVCYLRDIWKTWGDIKPGKAGIPGILYQWCQSYSNRERICKALNIEFETRDLDAEVSMAPSWEWYTAVQVGEIKNITNSQIPESLSNSGIPKRFTWGIGAGDVVESSLMISTYDHTKSKIGFSGEADRVYAYWLRFISKSEYWKNVPLQLQDRIAANLRDEILVQDQKEETGELWAPIEGLRAMGHIVNNDGQWNTEWNTE